VCGNWPHINEPASNLPLLVNICREIASNGVTITALTQLAQHVRYVTGAKRWCPKEGWTHLLDQACYAWKPRKNEVKTSSTRGKCRWQIANYSQRNEQAACPAFCATKAKAIVTQEPPLFIDPWLGDCSIFSVCFFIYPLPPIDFNIHRII